MGCGKYRYLLHSTVYAFLSSLFAPGQIVAGSLAKSEKRTAKSAAAAACDTERSVPNLIHARGLPAAVIAIVFALVARFMGAVTDGGAIAGVLVAFVLMLAAGFAGFLPFLRCFC